MRFWARLQGGPPLSAQGWAPGTTFEVRDGAWCATHKVGLNFGPCGCSAAMCRLHGPVAGGYTVTMSHFRLCYRDPGQRFNVVIMEAPSMIHARLKAALAARDGGMIFTEGHELGAEMAPLVQPGRVLSADEAMELLSRFKPTSGRVAKKPG